MKTILLALAFGSLATNAFGQQQATTFDDIKPITTSAGNRVELSWTKGAENISHFIIERSTNGHDFKLCGIVFLSEVPHFSAYKFRDEMISGQDVTYRIGSVMDDHTVSYLPARKRP